MEVSGKRRRRRTMTDTIKKVLMAVAAISALALGGAAIAGAVSSSSTATPQTDTATQDSATGSGNSAPSDRDKLAGGGQRSDETLLTGSIATKVTDAALAEVPGGTIERVETDADGHAAYEAHMVNADGSRVTVYVDEQFNVVGVEAFGSPGDQGQGDRQEDSSNGSGARQDGSTQGTNA
jgi:uncharacterized membrane protein YkoI